MTQLPQGVRVWIIREMQARRLKAEGPVVPRDPETGHREAAVVAVSDLPAVLAAERERWEAATLPFDREEVEAIAVELGAICPSESSFELGRPPFATYGRVLDKLRAALDSTKGKPDQRDLEESGEEAG
jgi:hypothetical protein